MFQIIECNIPYLYHTTTVYNRKSADYWNDEELNVPKPEYGKYHTKLHPKKYFTITEQADYGSSIHDFKFLRYKTLRPLKLLDIRNVKDYAATLRQINLNGVDGYMGREDFIEVFLKDPETCVSREYEVLDYQEKDDTFDHVKYEGYEDKRVIQWMLNKNDVVRKLFPEIGEQKQEELERAFDEGLAKYYGVSEFMDEQLRVNNEASWLEYVIPYAMALGWDINRKYRNNYGEFMTPLQSMLADRNVECVELILKYAKIPYFEDYYICIYGHRDQDFRWEKYVDDYGWEKYFFLIYKCIDLLDTYGGISNYNERWAKLAKKRWAQYGDEIFGHLERFIRK